MSLYGILLVMENENKDKHDFLLHLLSEGDAMVCLDARLPIVKVPKVHKLNPSLNLVFNLKFRRPLEINEDGIYTTLAFNGRPHKCEIPFDAVWAIYEPETQKGQVWEGAIPKDMNLAEKIMGKSSEETLRPQKAQISVKQGSKTDPDHEKPAQKKDRSHLRVIK
ncbi:MAG: ClpXP protease specificity-enhancing factor SspB [Nitrospinales bacterium]